MTAGRRPRLILDPELQPRIVLMVLSGAHPEQAAIAAGVSASTHFSWTAKGRDERAHIAAGGRPRKSWAPYLEYLDALDQASAMAEIELLAKVGHGGQGWQAQLALLERRFSERWSTKPAQARAEAPTGKLGGLDALALRRAQRAAGIDITKEA